MRLHEIEKKAIDEQLKSGFPDPEPGTYKRGRLTIDQIRSPRRRTEKILIEMIEELGPWTPPDPEPPRKRKGRRRRRGPRVHVAIYDPKK